MYTTIGDVSLNINSPQYQRPGGVSSNYRYAKTQVIVSVSGNYTFTSSSSFAAHLHLYTSSFDPSKPLVNLVAQGSTNAGNEQFQFTVFLSTDSQISRRVSSSVHIRMHHEENYSYHF